MQEHELLLSTLTNPAAVIICESLRGTRRSFKPSMLSKYLELHPDRACSELWTQVGFHLALGVYPLTWSQTSVVRLNIEIHFNHLAPTSTPHHSEDVPEILGPSVGMDATTHHLAMHKVKIVCGKREPMLVASAPSKDDGSNLLPSIQVINLQEEIFWQFFGLHRGVNVNPYHLLKVLTISQSDMNHLRLIKWC